MSTGTNKERLTQNNGIINENNADLTALKTRINNLPTSGDTTATASDIALGKTAVSKGVKITGTYTPPTVTLQSKDVTINQNGTTTITADTGYDGLSDVDVTVEGVLDTSDATATASDIAENKTAYVNGVKLTGTMEEPSPDWSEIGYSNVPQALLDNFAYSKDIYDNWDNTQTDLSMKFKGKKNMLFMPLVDTSNVTNMYEMFQESNLMELPLLDTSNVTNMESMFSNCYSLTSVPLLDTSKVTKITNMFTACSNLVTVPAFNWNSVRYAYLISNIFNACPKLSNDSLNNILASCISAVNYTGTKTLVTIGLSSAQATTCQTLSNWDAFVAAGWSSGY